jgi:hypothetical protein
MITDADSMDPETRRPAASFAASILPRKLSFKQRPKAQSQPACPAVAAADSPIPIASIMRSTASAFGASPATIVAASSDAASLCSPAARTIISPWLEQRARVGMPLRRQPRPAALLFEGYLRKRNPSMAVRR